MDVKKSNQEDIEKEHIMEPFIKITGIVAAMDRENVDTDQIIPAVYLKRIERTGFGQFLFSQPGWRFLPDILSITRGVL